MRKLITLTAILIASYSLHAQKPDCKRFKNGTFRIEDGKGGNMKLIRKGSKQTEILELTGQKYVFKVKWIDDCTYILSAIGASKKKFSSDDDVIVHIVSTTDNSYFIEAKAKSSQKLYRTEIKKIN